MKNNKGITLITLVVMIIIIPILASIASTTGVNVIRQSKYNRAVSEMKTMQTKINELYEDYKGENVDNIADFGTGIDDISPSLQSKAETAINSVNGNINNKREFRYLSSNYIKNTFDLDGVEGDYLVNIKTREVILIDGIKNDGEIYYSLNQIANEQFNVEYVNPSIKYSPDGGTYILPKTITNEKSLNMNIELSLQDIPNSINVNDLIIKYAWSTSKDTEPTEWIQIQNETTISENGESNVDSAGDYYLWTKVEDENGKTLNTIVSKKFTVKDEYDVKVRVAFDANGGTVEENNKNLINQEQYGELPTPTREGYTFSGWYTDKTDGTKVEATDNLELDESNLPPTQPQSQTLYAMWQGNDYTITYDYNGGVDSSQVLGKWDARDSQNTATVLKDLSGKNQNGTISNATLNNDSIIFNGTSSEVRFGTMNTDFMTIDVTFSVDELKNTVQLLMGNIETGGIAIYIGKTGIIGGEVYTNGEYKYIKSEITAEIGKKYHVILSYDGIEEKIFVNGELNNSIDIDGKIKKPNYNTCMALGFNPRRMDESDGSYFKGKIYSAAVYSNTKGSKTVTQGQEVGELPIPTREGYTFDGWYVDDNKIDSTTIYTMAKDVRLIAKWIPNTYTIRYNADEGSTGMMHDTVATYDQETNLATNTYQKNDYTYFKWNTKQDETGIKYDNEQNVFNLSAEKDGIVDLYTVFGYNITYNLNNGTLQNSNPEYYNENTGEFTLNNPEKKGNDFLGWTGSNSETPETTVTIPTGITGDLNYIANFNPHKLHIQYHANGGYMASSHGEGLSINDEGLIVYNGKTTIQNINYGSTLPENGLFDWDNKTYINIRKQGYTIVDESAWNTKPDGTGTSYNQKKVYNVSTLADLTDGDVTLTLYANWVPITYTINYDKNAEDATGEMESQTFKYDETQKLNKNTFERELYTFNGWNTKLDGSGTTYTDEQDITNLTATNNGNITLYAQ